MLSREQARVSGTKRRAEYSLKAPTMRSRVNTHRRMLSTIFNEQQAGPRGGQEAAILKLQKDKQESHCHRERMCGHRGSGG